MKDILNSIRKYNGCLITIIKDYNAINDDFIMLIQNKLQSDYVIEKDIEKIWKLNLNDITKKTIFLINYHELGIDKNDCDRKLRILVKTINNNSTIICVRKELQTTNTDIYGRRIGYSSSLILLLHKKKIKILKARYNDSLFSNLPLDLTLITRKIKLEHLNKET